MVGKTPRERPLSLPNPTQPDRFLIHGQVVTPATNEIARDQIVARIEPKSMEVLVRLIAHAGDVVSREELQDAIWGDVVVGDDSLTSAIIKIRKAFGDDARNPQVIETIPKRGYRLIATVEHETRMPPTAAQRGAKPAILVIALVAIAVIGSLFLFTGREPLPVTQNPVLQSALSDTRTRILVAPFLNLSGDPGQDYLVRGVEETLLTGLAQFPQIAAMQGQGTPSADYRLEGSVHHNGERIRVEVRLFEAGSGIVLSTERHEGDFSDLMAIEAEIEVTILSSLAIDIEIANRTSASRGYTHSFDAYDLFLRARTALLPRDRSGNAHARELYRQAIERDPRFARAYAGLALTHAADYRNGWAEDGQDSLDMALKMAQTALEIGPNMPEQLWVIGYVHTQLRDHAKAEAALKEALVLDPFYADAYALLAGVKTYAGQPESSVPLLREAIRLNPEAGYLYYLLLGRAYYFMQDCEQAKINLQEASARNPASVEARLYMAACLVDAGELGDAQWEVEEVLNMAPSFSIESFFISYPMTDREQIETLTHGLNMAGAT
jgi:DNA-binding winged helix-turn-helix (wHTH) protein/TolB-like protein/Tfp pilus assembly protein PilF